MAADQRILFIGAPFGAVFRELAAALEANGALVLRVVVDGGDLLETPKRNRVFRAQGQRWAVFIRDLLVSRRITAVVTYNDTLPRNRIALKLARRLGIDRLVLENGYLRPHHVTLAVNGVNGNSELSRRADVVRLARPPAQACRTFPVRMRPHVVNTIRHFFWSTILKPVLPYDTRYYGDSIGRQAIGYMREYAWRLRSSECEAFARVEAAPGLRFLVLMQKPGDGQIRFHSRFDGNAAFLEEVMRSFAAHAPPDAFLVAKQHPLDYGIERLPLAFARLSDELGLGERAVYLRKTPIARVLQLAHRLVTINSTGGLQGLMDRLPVKCLGKAVYDIPGLTFQGSLDEFWSQAAPPEEDILESYRHYLLSTCQINGGFHTREARDILIPELSRRILFRASWRPQADDVTEGERSGSALSRLAKGALGRREEGRRHALPSEAGGLRRRTASA